jgi:hypothetical protein
MKFSKEGSEIAAAIIAAAGTEVKTLDSILSNYFKVLAAMEAVSKQEGAPQIAGFQSLDD